MIIQIRGTSGSGKSTVMRNVMDYMGGWNSVKVEGRKQPLYYVSDSSDGWPETIVLGHYESACGGCDTIGSAKAVWELTSKLRNEFPNAHILQEGLLLSEDVKWTSNMPGVVVLFLTTSLDTCLIQIKSRREKAGNDKPLNPANTTNRVTTIERARVKLTGLGVDVRRCSANQAPKIVTNLLRLHAQKES